VEADRLVIDTLREPLLHLVRNAVDHGIETPDVRERAGKRPAGTVAVSGWLHAGRLRVAVSDDGAGLDEEAIRASLRSRGTAVPATSHGVGEALLLGSFSTRSEATSISGRGVGLDAVRTALERIGGTVDVRWDRGAGTTFTLECPPSPATLHAALFRIGAHTFAVPPAHIERQVRVTTDDLRRAGGRLRLRRENGPVPLHALGTLLGPPLEPGTPAEGGAALLVSTGERRAAMLVDEVLEEDEIVVR